MKAIAKIERGTDSSFSVFIESDNVPFGVIGDGATVAEAIADFNNSVDEMRICYAEQGKEFPQDLEFSFKYAVSAFLKD